MTTPAKPEVGGLPATTGSPAQVAQSSQQMQELLQLALREKAPVETMERLVALKERMEDRNAQQQFFAALADFQKVCPRIRKEGTVDYVPTSGGQRVKYSYAMLDDIDAVVRPMCNERGLYYSWDSTVEGATVRCTFKLRHIAGHMETSTFACPATSKAGMSDQQKFGAAVKYAMRWSLIQGLGLVTTDDDNDAAEVDQTPIDADQVVRLEEMIEARHWKNPAKSMAKFLAHMGVDSLAQIRAEDFAKATAALAPPKEAAPSDPAGAQ